MKVWVRGWRGGENASCVRVRKAGWRFIRCELRELHVSEMVSM